MPYRVVKDFEDRVADFAGSKYAVAVESGTAAIFLSCVYRKVKDVFIPKHTYPSVPCSIIHAGGRVHWTDQSWSGVYELAPYGIVDGALRFRRGMFQTGTLHCLSFHIKKLIPIGRGGMILTDDAKADEWFRLARFDGRHPVPLSQDNFTVLGYNAYMTPEQAAKGIQIFEMVKDKVLADLSVSEQGYPDLSRFDVYNVPARHVT